MPNWKKVITSGSNAELNQITASAGIKGTLDTAAQGNITSLGTLTTLTVDWKYDKYVPEGALSSAVSAGNAVLDLIT